MSDLALRGATWGGSGSPTPLTSNLSGAQRVTDAHARYMQAALEGRIFFLDSGSITLAAANTTVGAMGTAKTINGLFNPVNSGKNIAIILAVVATVSGTPAGPFFYNFYSGLLVNSAPTGIVRSSLLTNAAGPSVAIPQANVVLTTNPASTAALLQLGVLGGPAAIAAGAGNYSATDEVAGRIIVPPGTVFAIMAAGAGTTHIVQSTLIWEEIPILP